MFIAEVKAVGQSEDLKKETKITIIDLLWFIPWENYTHTHMYVCVTYVFVYAAESISIYLSSYTQTLITMPLCIVICHLTLHYFRKLYCDFGNMNCVQFFILSSHLTRQDHK